MGCSAKGRIWTGEENWSFGNFGGGGVGVLPKVGFGLREENWSLEILGGGCSCQRSDLDSGKKIGVLEIWEGVFCQRSDLDSGKKIGVLVIWGGGRAEVFLPIWSKISGSLACLCITDSLSHTTYVETNKTARLTK